jgi:hypothetical protein
MKYHYPLSLVFKITTLSSDFTVTDARDQSLFYVRQKMFKFKEEVLVHKDTNQTQRLYSIKANKWLDFSAAYNFTNAMGQDLGKVARKGWVSIFKSHYEVFDVHQNLNYSIREENAWVKVIDGLLSDIPLVGLFSGYFFNPAYLVTNQAGAVVARLQKQKSLIGRRFKLDKVGDFSTEAEEERVLLSLMMMVLLERSRG